jgi:hypothetical protein
MAQSTAYIEKEMSMNARKTSIGMQVLPSILFRSGTFILLCIKPILMTSRIEEKFLSSWKSSIYCLSLRAQIPDS